MKERSRRNARIAATLAVSLLVAAPVAAEAKKPANSSKLKTVSSAAVPVNRGSGAQGPIAVARATCPEKTAAVSGGFTASPPFIPDTWANATTWVNVFQSQMVGNDTWEVSARQFVQQGVGSLVAHVYCQKRKNALEATPVTTAMPSTTNASIGVTATCPSGKALSGGFSSPLPTDTNTDYVWSSFRVSDTAWRVEAANVAGPGGILAATVYCGTGKVKERSGTTAVTPPGGSVFSATPEDCPKKNKPFAGGFATSQPLLGLMDTALVYDSRRDGKRWITSAGPSNNTASETLTSYSYCRRR